MTLPPPPEETPAERRAAERARDAAQHARGAREKEVENRRSRAALSLTTAGLTLALSIGIGVGLGIWLDGVFKTRGVLVMVFSLVGIIAGFKQLIQLVVRAGKEQDRADEEERRGRR